MNRFSFKKHTKQVIAFLLAFVVIVTTFFSGHVHMNKVKAADDMTVNLMVGRSVDYNGYRTHQFKLDDGIEAYCVQPSKKYPDDGAYKATSINNELLAKVLYLGYGGAGYYTDGGLYNRIDPSVRSDEDMLLYWTHVMAAYAYGSDDAFKAVDEGTVNGLKNIVKFWEDWCTVPSSFKAYIFNPNQKTQTMAFGYYEPTGYASLKKTSANPSITNGNTCYSLEGAEYGIYSDQGCTNRVGTFTTDANGNSNTVELDEGTYWVKESKASKGYCLDDDKHPITVKSGETTTLNVTEEPGNDPTIITLNKIDKDTGEVTQANASLEGAQFTFKYYDGYYTRETLPAQATRTWVQETRKLGNTFSTRLSDSYKVSGDDYFRDPNGNPVLPLGTITIEETKAPDGYLLEGAFLQVADSTEKIEGIYVAQIRKEGELVRLTGGNTFTMSDSVIRGGVRIQKYDLDTQLTVPQGDATLAGAEFDLINMNDGPVYVDGINYAAGETILTLTTDKDGFAQTASDVLPYGHYMIRERKAPEGYLNAGVIEREFDITENGEMVDLTAPENGILNRAMKGNVLIVKHTDDGSTQIEQPEVGAEFQIYLKSAGSYEAAREVERDTFACDEDGFAESKDLPCGTYIVHQTKGWPDRELIHDFEVTISKDGQVRRFIINNRLAEAYVRLVKKDAQTGKTVLLSDVSFKILNAATGEYVTQKLGDKKVDTFITDETGTVTTPLKLPAGNYEVVEIKTAYGYTICNEKIPFAISGDGVLQAELDEEGEPFIVVEVENDEVTGTVTIHKHGEVLDGVEKNGLLKSIRKMVSKLLGNEADPDTEFFYKDADLSGAVFELIADEDIYTPDHQVDADGNRILAVYNGVSLSKGAVAATVTTGKDGTAVIKGLPLGTYRVVEVQAPNGYVLNENEQVVTLAYADEVTSVVYETAEFENARQKVAIGIVKTDSETEKPIAGAEFSLYAGKDMVNYDGKVVVKKDTLLETAVSDKDGNVLFTKDYPFASYYVKETKASAGYASNEETFVFDAAYQGQDKPVAEYVSEVKNIPTTVEFTKTDITGEQELDGATLTILDKDGNVVETWVSKAEEPHVVKCLPVGDYVLREEIAPYGYVIASDVEFTVEDTAEIQKVSMTDEVSEGKIIIWKTIEGTDKPLAGAKFEIRDSKGNVLETLTTDENGRAESQILPAFVFKDGKVESAVKYTVVEVEAPEGYELDGTPQEVEFAWDDGKNPVVEQEVVFGNKPKAPKTGDETPIGPWAALGTVSVCVLAGATAYGVKRKKKND